MLWQLHHQFKDGHTEMMAQFGDAEGHPSVFKEWVREIIVKFPLPEDAQWMACNEKSEFFVKQKEG